MPILLEGLFTTTGLIAASIFCSKATVVDTESWRNRSQLSARSLYCAPRGISEAASCWGSQLSFELSAAHWQNSLRRSRRRLLHMHVSHLCLHHRRLHYLHRWESFTISFTTLCQKSGIVVCRSRISTVRRLEVRNLPRCCRPIRGPQSLRLADLDITCLE